MTNVMIVGVGIGVGVEPCYFCVSFDWCFDVLTGSHGEEKGSHKKIDHVIVFDALLAGYPS